MNIWNQYLNNEKFSGMLSFFKKGLLLFFISQSILLLISFTKWGIPLSSDMLCYFNSAKTIQEGAFPHSQSYSPGYPFCIAMLGNLFNISLEQAALIFAAVFYAINIFTVYSIFLLLQENKNKLLSMLLSFMAVHFWWSIRIMINAHADVLFTSLHLFILYLLVRYSRTGFVKLYFLACLFASLGVWVKYNSLVYLPFLALFPIYYNGWNKKSILSGLIPILLTTSSFLIFKAVNGAVINHLETSNRSGVFLQDGFSTNTLFTNLSDGGTVILQIFLADFAEKANFLLRILVFLSFTLASVYYIIKYFGTRNILASILLFSITYFSSLIILFQLSNHIEVNIRTAFPALIGLLIIFLVKVIKEKSYLLLSLLFLFLLVQPARTSYALIRWYKKPTIDSYEYAKDFAQKKSLVRLRELMKNRSITPADIYTNDFRHLVIYFNYEWVKMIPVSKEFKKGRYQEVKDSVLDNRLLDMKAGVKDSNKLIICFNYDPIQLSKYFEEGMTVEYIEKDAIIYQK